MIGFLDGFTGTEVRLTPIYFVPVILAGISLNQVNAYIFAIGCSVVWGISNFHGGLRFSSEWIWVWNLTIQAVAFVIVLELVRQLQNERIKAHEMSMTDTLTGIPNARGFYEQSHSLVSFCHRQQMPIVLAYIDLDNFKTVNDKEGHQRGNDILKIIAQIMKSTFRASDVISRLGGDEFAVILPNTEVSEAHEVLERFRVTTMKEMNIAGNSVSTSIGAIAYSNSPLDLEAMIKTADQIMYDVKHTGKNQVSIKKFYVNDSA
ncbi:GGDEF domain-containing protein [Methylomonas koyamae]|uniref:GGDEF domain-containing protein n=1 Tax=Methylomonas koyamae TaxID=702114 RepID=UPI001128028E|nr:GGDEF domain-containing protein [Methylomonas koyamae]TPQ27585.1 hypothetical protein C2U68_07695 [Methylomonas koyamae]